MDRPKADPEQARTVSVGDMFLTVMGWLNNVPAGGGTGFDHPQKSQLIEPTKGSTFFIIFDRFGLFSPILSIWNIMTFYSFSAVLVYFVQFDIDFLNFVNSSLYCPLLSFVFLVLFDLI